MFRGAMREGIFAQPMGGAAAVSTFAPTDLSGLKLWYKPRSLALNDGDAISTNTDYSGNGWNATQTLTARPTFKTGIVNGLAIARYDGSNDTLVIASGALGITNNVASCTVVCVASTTTVSAGMLNMLVLSRGTSAASRVVLGINNTAAKIAVGARRQDVDGSVIVSGATSLSTSTFYILVMQLSWTTATIDGYINGGAADAHSASFQTAGNTSATDSVNANLGAAAASQFWSGDIGDQLVYVPALSLANLNLLGAYLGTTYNLTWTTAT